MASFLAIVLLVGCFEATGLPPEGYSGPHFEGTILRNGSPLAGASIRGTTRWMDDCDDGSLFSRARTRSDEAGSYSLGLEGFAGWDGGVGSELAVVCAELIAENEAWADTVRVDGMSVRFLLADTIRLDFELH